MNVIINMNIIKYLKVVINVMQRFDFIIDGFYWRLILNIIESQSPIRSYT